MLNQTIPIQVQGSLPETRLITYIQDHYEEINIDKRPLVLICPGGAYAYTSVREGEALAMQFLAMGYHAAVLKYSCAPAISCCTDGAGNGNGVDSAACGGMACGP